jgi:anti-sigma regulatory factor (Ser/Thr protein kinase)
VCSAAELVLPCDPRAASLGRRFAVDRLTGWGVMSGDPAWDALEDVSLITSELVGNASRFCTTDIILGVVAQRDHIHMAITDDNPTPARPRAANPDAAGGRGLCIVEALTSSWGQTPFDGNTKTVWANVAFHGESVLAQGCQRPGPISE